MRSLMCLAFLFASFNIGFAQITVTTANGVRSPDGKSLTFNIMVAANTAQPTKVALLTSVFNLSPVPPGTVTVTYVEGPAFVGLANPTPGWTSPRARAVQSASPEPSAVPVTMTPAVYGTMTITTTALMPTGQITATAQTTTPNPQMQAVIYLNGTTTAIPTSVALGTIVFAPATPLPVTLSTFRAVAKGASNLIKWITVSENNASHHIIDRSNDGVANWLAVGQVKANGNSENEVAYSLEDKAPASVSYYRLRTIDVDGSEVRSQVVVVVRGKGGFGITSVYPSPTKNQATVQFDTENELPATIQVFDLTGRLVLVQEAVTVKGTNVTELELGTLEAGVYSVQVMTVGAISQSVKLVKQ
jgi:Secretion system C-terminal sorting domain